MSNSEDEDFEIGGVFATYGDDLKKFGIDLQGIARHVCAYHVNEFWELHYTPSYSTTNEFQSARPIEKQSGQSIANRAKIAECVERIFAYQLGRDMERWAGPPSLNKCALAFNAQVAMAALRDTLEKVRAISEKRSAAAYRRHEIAEGPVRAELERLLEAHKPIDGWRDEKTAVRTISPHIRDFLRRDRPGMQEGDYLERVLIKWTKTHPDVKLIFAKYSAPK